MIKPYIEAFSRFGGLVAVCLEWLAVIFFYITTPSNFGGEHPISYFATLPHTRVVFSICYTLAALSFWIFTYYHLNKHFWVPNRLFSLSMLGFAAVALVPFDPGNAMSNLMHSVLALFFSVTFLAAIYFMAKNNNDHRIRAVSIATVVLSGIFLVLFLFPMNPQLTLVFEVISGVLGQVWIVWISLRSLRLR